MCKLLYIVASFHVPVYLYIDYLMKSITDFEFFIHFELFIFSLLLTLC